MATTNTKTPSERRPIPFHFENLISGGAALVSAMSFASRKLAALTPPQALHTTTLSANITAEDSSVQLWAHPGVGARLIVNPGGLTEEEFKVSAVSGGSPPYAATIVPTAEFPHTSGDSVEYEPGASDRLIVDTTPTPVDADVIVETWHGASGQIYRLSTLGTCDNGEIVELELDLLVSEIAPGSTKVKQPGETRDYAFPFPGLLDGETLDSARVFISRVAAASTTLADLAAIGATTVSLSAHPGVGALLTINAAGPNMEILKVSAVAGGGPYVATVDPTVEFAHTNGEPVAYEPGASGRLLVSSTPTIIGDDAIVRAHKGADAQIYRATMLGLNAGSTVIVQNSTFIATTEL